jgi:BirA family biotin operon repressor/biotin-[acetyl-CoA-carboxylase] ligase
LAQWDRSRGFAAILADWLKDAGGIGEPITVRDGDTQIQGRFVGLDHAGQLVLERADGGLTKIAAGDVFPFAMRGQSQGRAGAFSRPG